MRCAKLLLASRGEARELLALPGDHRFDAAARESARLCVHETPLVLVAHAKRCSLNTVLVWRVVSRTVRVQRCLYVAVYNLPRLPSAGALLVTLYPHVHHIPRPRDCSAASPPAAPPYRVLWPAEQGHPHANPLSPSREP